MKAIQLKNYDTEGELLQEIRNTNNGRYQHRLRTILLAKRGMTIPLSKFICFTHISITAGRDLSYQPLMRT